MKYSIRVSLLILSLVISVPVLGNPTTFDEYTIEINASKVQKNFHKAYDLTQNLITGIDNDEISLPEGYNKQMIVGELHSVLLGYAAYLGKISITNLNGGNSPVGKSFDYLESLGSNNWEVAVKYAINLNVIYSIINSNNKTSSEDSFFGDGGDDLLLSLIAEKIFNAWGNAETIGSRENGDFGKVATLLQQYEAYKNSGGVFNLFASGPRDRMIETVISLPATSDQNMFNGAAVRITDTFLNFGEYTPAMKVIEENLKRYAAKYGEDQTNEVVRQAMARYSSVNMGKFSQDIFDKFLAE